MSPMNSRIFAIRLQPDMDLKQSLWEFTQTNHIQAGFMLTAVGSLKRAVIRYAGQPATHQLDGKFEIVSLVGTLSLAGVHLHIAIADGTGKTIGGHLGNGSLIYTTAELVMGESLRHRFLRPHDEQTDYHELEITEVP